MPTDSQSINIEDKELSKDDVYDLLKEDDDTPIEKKEETKKEDKKVEKDEDEDEKDEREKDEEDELEIEEEEKEEEEDELVVAPRRKEILKEFPELFKKFPYIEKALYRDQQFTELFSNPKEAKEIAERSKLLGEFQHDIVEEANIEKLLYSVKQVNQNSFNKIADNYLQTLAKVDKDAYLHVVSGVIENMIVSMSREGKASKIEQLEEAAHILNQFFFGTSEFRPRAPLSHDDKNPEADKLQADRESFIRERFESARDNLDERVDNALRSTINEHIDPKGVMTDYVKRNAVSDTLDKVKTAIEQDDRFQSYLDRLWEKAFEDKFSRTSIDKIRSAYFTKAKTLLRDAIRESRNDALKDVRGKKEERDRKGPLPAGRTTAEKSSTTESKAIPKGMKTLDFLMQD